MKNADKNPVQLICDYCGSPNIVFDAYAEWNAEDQKAELHSFFSHCECMDCGGKTNYNEVPFKTGQIFPVYFSVELNNYRGTRYVVKALERSYVEYRFKDCDGNPPSVKTIARTEIEEGLSINYDLTKSQ